jgi:segregation and condensation protein A
MANHAAEGVLEHLLFHKAMIDDDAGSDKVDRYLKVLGDTGSQVLQRDPLDRSIEMVFELVLSNDLDPWDIDLMRFTQLYAEKVRDQEVNFVLAGKLMLMAWSILRMQSERVLSNSEVPVLECYDTEDVEMFPSDQPRTVLRMPDEIELDEVVRHRGSRPVTLFELLDAFEEANGRRSGTSSERDCGRPTAPSRTPTSTPRPTTMTWRGTWRWYGSVSAGAAPGRST